MPLSSFEQLETSQLEDAVISSVLALGISLNALEEGYYTTACDRIHLTMNRALRDLAERANERGRLNQLPTELFAYIASLLSPRDIARAALVCRSWRATLIGFPGLWTRLCLLLDRDTGSTMSSMTTLLSRSNGRPLTIELECTPVAVIHMQNDTASRIATTIMEEMHRVESLSLVLPDLRGTEFERIIHAPAPMLKCFRIHSAGNMYDIPVDLFQLEAPRLNHVSFYGMLLPDDGECEALKMVTQLFYDSSSLENQDIIAITRQFPLLRCLTWVGQRCDVFPMPNCICPRALTLRLPHLQDVDHVIDSFPNAISVCLSSTMDDYAATAIITLIKSTDKIMSLAFYSRPRHWGTRPLFLGLTASEMAGAVAINMNGVDVAVDLSEEDAARTIEELHDHLEDLRSLSTLETFWWLFAEMAMPELYDLTLYLDIDAWRSQPWQAAMLRRKTFKAPGFFHTPSSLSLVAPPSAGMPDILESAIVEMIRVLFYPKRLRTLVLCGLNIVLDHQDDSQSLRALCPSLEIVSTCRPQQDPVEPWCWALPMDEALRI